MGAAVRATRAQADRILYKAAIREMLENQPNLEIFQQSVEDITLEGERASGVKTAMGVEFKGRAVVLTAGTFLAGKIHIGLENYAGGRAGDPAAQGLSGRLKELLTPRRRADPLPSPYPCWGSRSYSTTPSMTVQSTRRVWMSMGSIDRMSPERTIMSASFPTSMLPLIPSSKEE